MGCPCSKKRRVARGFGHSATATDTRSDMAGPKKWDGTGDNGDDENDAPAKTEKPATAKTDKTPSK